MLHTVNKLEKLLKQLKSNVNDVALQEAEMYDKKFDHKNLSIERREGRKTYSFKHLPKWVELDNKKKGPFHGIRIKAIMSLSPEERMALMVARAKAVPELPEAVDKEDTRYVFQTVKQYPEENQQAFMAALKKAFDTAGIPMPEM